MDEHVRVRLIFDKNSRIVILTIKKDCLDLGLCSNLISTLKLSTLIILICCEEKDFNE